jgi:LPPG:FO 2-phospho-L-lactate transferase
VTARLAADLGVGAHILPMSDAPVRTMIRTPGGRLTFQEYFVREKALVEVVGVDYEGAASARPAPGVVEAIRAADVVVVCPSNPVTSVGPILAVPGIVDALRATPAPVVAVSPIVAGAALRGPADQMLVSLQGESSALAVARHYATAHPGLLDDFGPAAIHETGPRDAFVTSLRVGLVATGCGAALLLWVQLSTGHPLTWLPLVIAALALVAALAANAIAELVEELF